MTRDEIMPILEPWLKRHERPTWKPVTESRVGPLTGSKFGGTPWTGPAAPWPACGECNELMPLFLQLDLAQLPPQLAGQFGDGLLQLFYCTGDCEDGWGAFSVSQSVRVVTPIGGPKPTAVPGDTLPEKCITGWTRGTDQAQLEELHDLGLTVDYSTKLQATFLTCPGSGLADELVPENLFDDIGPTAGDKLAGWPYWIQGPEYPTCPKCKREMQFVFQVDSEDNVPFMFGDAGCGHVTQCPAHKEVVAFGWACS